MTPTTPSSSSDCMPLMHYHTATLSQNSMPTLTPSSTHPPPIFHSSSTHPPPIFYPSFIYPPPSSFTPFSSFLTRPPFTHFNPPHSSFIPSFSLISPILPSPILPSPILPSPTSAHFPQSLISRGYVPGQTRNFTRHNVGLLAKPHCSGGHCWSFAGHLLRRTAFGGACKIGVDVGSILGELEKF